MDRTATQQVATGLLEYVEEACRQAIAPTVEPPADQSGTGWFTAGPFPRTPWSYIDDATVASLNGVVIFGFTWQRGADEHPANYLLPVDLRDFQGHPHSVVNSIIEALDLRLETLVAEQEQASRNDALRVLDLLTL